MEEKKYIIGQIKGLAFDMRNDCDGSYVGEGGEEIIEYDNKKYKVVFDAFWEKCSHIDYSITGVNHEYSEGGMCEF